MKAGRLTADGKPTSNRRTVEAWSHHGEWHDGPPRMDGRVGRGGLSYAHAGLLELPSFTLARSPAGPETWESTGIGCRIQVWDATPVRVYRARRGTDWRG